MLTRCEEKTQTFIIITEVLMKYGNAHIASPLSTLYSRNKKIICNQIQHANVLLMSLLLNIILVQSLKLKLHSSFGSSIMFPQGQIANPPDEEAAACKKGLNFLQFQHSTHVTASLQHPSRFSNAADPHLLKSKEFIRIFQ